MFQILFSARNADGLLHSSTFIIIRKCLLLYGKWMSHHQTYVLAYTPNNVLFCKELTHTIIAKFLHIKFFFMFWVGKKQPKAY